MIVDSSQISTTLDISDDGREATVTHVIRMGGAGGVLLIRTGPVCVSPSGSQLRRIESHDE